MFSCLVYIILLLVTVTLYSISFSQLYHKFSVLILPSGNKTSYWDDKTFKGKNTLMFYCFLSWN